MALFVHADHLDGLQHRYGPRQHGQDDKPGHACYQPAMAEPMLTILPGWDMYEFHLVAVAALRKAGLHDQARELHQRGLDAPSFYHMRELVQEYVTGGWTNRNEDRRVICKWGPLALIIDAIVLLF